MSAFSKATDQTRALTNWNNIQIGLTNPKDVRNNAYFGVTDVKIDNKESSYVVQNPMKSVLSELTVIIENVPKGTEMSGKALDAAWCLFPTQKNSDGEYGLPSIEPTEVEIPTILATESTLQSEVIRLMPTIRGSSASHIYLRLLLPNGTLQEYDITAPAMKVGGKYELRLNQPYRIPKGYHEQLVLNAEMYVEQQQKEHAGMKKIDVKFYLPPLDEGIEQNENN